MEKQLKILVTGFDPFGGEKINPSFEAVRLLPDELNGAKLIKCCLPVTFADSVTVLKEKVAEHRPDIIFSVGQAGGRSCVSVERIGINIADAGIADNAGVCPHNEPLIPGGPDAYLSSLPVQEMVDTVRAHELPCSLSNTAGTYVCNCVLYNAMHLCRTQYPGMRAGFIHVPFIPQQIVKSASNPSMSLEMIAETLKILLEVLIK